MKANQAIIYHLEQQTCHVSNNSNVVLCVQAYFFNVDLFVAAKIILLYEKLGSICLNYNFRIIIRIFWTHYSASPM